MSTIAYAQLTKRREASTPGTSSTQAPPGVSSYIDTVAALVPAEILTLHAFILSFTTQQQVIDGVSSTIISEPGTLRGCFYGLLVLNVIFFVLAKLPKWDRFDAWRCLIPPLAFVAWTMLQKSTAFDAVCPDLPMAPRSGIAVFLAVLLGAGATYLSKIADQKPL